MSCRAKYISPVLIFVQESTDSMLNLFSSEKYQFFEQERVINYHNDTVMTLENYFLHLSLLLWRVVSVPVASGSVSMTIPWVGLFVPVPHSTPRIGRKVSRKRRVAFTTLSPQTPWHPAPSPQHSFSPRKPLRSMHLSPEHRSRLPSSAQAPLHRGLSSRILR